MDAKETIVACVAPFLRRNEVQKSIFSAFVPDSQRRQSLDETALVAVNRLVNVPESEKTSEEAGEEEEGREGHDGFRKGSTASQTGRFALKVQKIHIRNHQDTHRPIVYSETESAVLAIEIVGLDRIVMAITKRKGVGWSEAIHGIAGRYFCQIVDIVESFGGEIVKFMTDLIYIKWDLGDNPATKNRELVEAITCGVQLLTELADYTVEHHNTPPTSTQNVGSSSDGNQASMLEYAGVGAPVLDPLSPASSAPTTVTLRMKLGLVVGIVTNVVLGSWGRMDYSLFGPCIDDLSDIILSCPIGELQIQTSAWQTVSSISGVLAQTIIATNEKTISFSRFPSNPFNRQRSASVKSSRSNSRNQNRRRSLDSSSDFISLRPPNADGSPVAPTVKREGGSRPWRRAPAMRRLSEGNEGGDNSNWFMMLHAQLTASRPGSSAGYAKMREESSPAEATKGLLLSTMVNRLLVEQIIEEKHFAATPSHLASVVLINILDLDIVESIQRALVSVVEEAERQNGIFHQWFSARNQRIIMCIFGLNNERSDDDEEPSTRSCAMNAAIFASNLHKKFNTDAIPNAIGIVTSETFLTMIGNMNRSDAFVLNSSIAKCFKHLAIPEVTDKIICCEATQTMLTTSSSISPDSRRFTFPVLGKFMVRGSAKMTPIIELVDVLFPLSWSRARGPRNRPVGLEKQSDHLRDSFLKWLNNQDPSPLPVDRNRVLKGVAELQRHDLRNWMMDDRNGFVITGLPGHGKTMLANEIIHEIKNCKCAISSISLCFSSCVPDHSARVAFGALRKFIITIAQSVVKMEQDSIFKNQFAVLEAAAEVVGLDKRFAAATAASIGSYLTDGAVKPVTGWVDEISPKDRVDVAISTVVAILQYGCAIGKRYVLIVDDFQWLDACSVRLLYRIIRDCPKVFTIVFSRPMSHGAILEPELNRISSLPGVQPLTLDPLTPSNIAELLSFQWGGRGAGIKRVDMALCEMIHRITLGDPLFTSLLCKVLRTRSSVGKLQLHGTPAQGPTPASGNAGTTTSTYDSFLNRHKMSSASAIRKPSMDTTVQPTGFSLSMDNGNTGSNDLTSGRRISLAQPAQQTKEDLPSPLVIDDDGVLRSRRWPALDLSGATFLDLVQGIYERCGFNLRRIFASAAIFGQGFTVEDVMAGIEGPATLSEIMLSFDEDIEGLIVPMEYLDTDVFGIARPHNSHSNLSSREHTDTDRRPHRVSTLRQPPSTLLGFRSILIAQVIYDTQNFMTRQSTHARFAAHLQQRVPLMMSRIAYHREKANDVVGVMTCVATLARTFWEGGLEEEMRIFLQKLMGLAGGGWGSLDVGQRAEWLMMLAEAYIEKGDSMKANETILSVFKLVKIYYPKTPFGRKFYRWRSFNRMKHAINHSATLTTPPSSSAKKSPINTPSDILFYFIDTPHIPQISDTTRCSPPSTAARAFQGLQSLSLLCGDPVLNSWLAYEGLASTLKPTHQRPNVSVTNLLPAFTWLITLDASKRHRRLRASKDGEISTSSDLETTLMKVIVEMVEREPSVSPVSMEVGVTFGQWFLESGFVREANIAFRAAVEAADVFDRWNTWAKGSTGLITTSLLLGDFTPIHQLVDPRIALFRLGPAVEVKKTDLDEVLGVLLGATVVNVILGACTGESPYRMHMDLVIKFMCPSSTNTWTNEMGSKPSLRKVSPDAFTDPKKRRASEKEVGAKGEFGARISGLDGKNSEGAESKFTTQVRTEVKLKLDQMGLTSTKMLASAVNFLVLSASNHLTAAVKAYTTVFDISPLKLLVAESKRYRGIPNLMLIMTTVTLGMMTILDRVDGVVVGEERGVAVASMKWKCGEHRAFIKFFRKVYGIPETGGGGLTGTSAPSCHLDVLALLAETLVEVVEAGGKATEKSRGFSEIMKGRCEGMGMWGHEGHLLGALACLVYDMARPGGRGAGEGYA